MPESSTIEPICILTTLVEMFREKDYIYPYGFYFILEKGYDRVPRDNSY